MLGLRGYGTGVAQDTHHLGEEGERGWKMLEIWKIEDQSTDRFEEITFFLCQYRVILTCHGTDANRNIQFQL